MEYSNYKNSRDLAWKLLIKYNITSLPVKVSDICKNERIKLINYSTALGSAYDQNRISNDGFTRITTHGSAIFYNDNMSIGRQRFTVAHELGHILLGHVNK